MAILRALNIPCRIHGFTYGKLDDFVNRFSDWTNVSPYLLILFSNLKDFIFIDALIV
jgi:hypothetical protein